MRLVTEGELDDKEDKAMELGTAALCVAVSGTLRMYKLQKDIDRVRVYIRQNDRLK